MMPSPRQPRRGFTLVELMTVVLIISILIAILLPVISKVKKAGYTANTKNELNVLMSAIDAYHLDFRAYPGPLSNDQVSNANNTMPGGPFTAFNASGAVGFDASVPDQKSLTMCENLTLALFGGFRVTTPAAGVFNLTYDPASVGQGPGILTTAGQSVGARHAAYVTDLPLSWQMYGGLKTGKYGDDAAPLTSATAGGAGDSTIPEIVDKFPDPMPILYLRAKVGANPTGAATLTNDIITNDATDVSGRVGQYDLSQIDAYTSKNSAGQYIGTGRSVSKSDYTTPSAYPGHGLSTVTRIASIYKAKANYVFPYDAYPYLSDPSNPPDATNPNVNGQPRQKDGYILIDPGPDRTYGTADDICSFGEVLPQ